MALCNKFIKLPGLFVLLMAVLAACEKLDQSNILDKTLASGEPFFSILYNKRFAQRFFLPISESYTLTENLQAIAVEFNKVNFGYSCELHLYIDSDLEIFNPEPGSYYTIKPNSEYFFASKYNDRDLEGNSYEDLNHMRIRFNSDSQVSPALRFTRTLSYTRIHHAFLPDLTIVSLNTNCGMFNRTHYPAAIWIQKQEVGDYLLGNDGLAEIKYPENSYRFQIPIQLIEQIAPYVKIAEQGNSRK